MKMNRMFVLLILCLSTFNAKAFSCTNSRFQCTRSTCRSATYGYETSLQSTAGQELLIQSLLEQTREESDGTKLPISQRDSINAIVQSLEDMTSQDHVLDMTSTPLEGEHRLIYIDSESNPQYIGPFKGTTTQYFVDDEVYENRLSLGPIQVVLTALRRVIDKNDLKVDFQSFAVNIFGKKIFTKELKQRGGVWKMVYVGEVDDTANGAKKKILLRVLRAPSLYILAKDL